MAGMPCPDCFSGAIHNGNPTGTTTTILGLPTYVAQPADGTEPKGIIVYISDVFGWDFVNSRVLADHYAKRGGFLVYVPDFMNGDAVDPIALLLLEKIMKPASWLTTIFYKPVYVLKVMSLAILNFWKTRLSVSRPRIFDFFQALRISPPPFPTNNLKIGAAGFCWGGLYTVLLAQDTPSSRVARYSVDGSSSALKPLIDCGFAAHPSYLTVPTNIEPVNIPLSVAVGDADMALKLPHVLKMKEVLEADKRGDHEVVIMSGAKHGFAVRTEPHDELQMNCAEKAETQAIEWFLRWLA